MHKMQAESLAALFRMALGGTVPHKTRGRDYPQRGARMLRRASTLAGTCAQREENHAPAGVGGMVGFTFQLSALCSLTTPVTVYP